MSLGPRCAASPTPVPQDPNFDSKLTAILLLTATSPLSSPPSARHLVLLLRPIQSCGSCPLGPPTGESSVLRGTCEQTEVLQGFQHGSAGDKVESTGAVMNTTVAQGSSSVRACNARATLSASRCRHGTEMGRVRFLQRHRFAVQSSC